MINVEYLLFVAHIKGVCVCVCERERERERALSRSPVPLTEEEHRCAQY